MNWTYNPQDYTANTFKPLNEGDYRVRISNATARMFSNGKAGFEITLDVSGHNSKLWLYITLDPLNEKRTNQQLGAFFNSFDITDYSLDDCSRWIGKMGAVRVKHTEYEGRTMAKVAFCLSRDQQDRLPEWKDKPSVREKDQTDWSEAPKSSNAMAAPSFLGRSFGADGF